MSPASPTTTQDVEIAAVDGDSPDNPISIINIESSLENLFRLKRENPTNLICSYLNINSIRNKIKDVSLILKDNCDILTIAESKLDASFPTAQFYLEGYSLPYRLDITRNSGGLLVYIRQSIPSRFLKQYEIKDLQIIPIELNLRKERWLVVSLYRPPKQSLSYFLNSLSKLLDFYHRTYNKILVMGDFNAEPDVPIMASFLKAHNLYNHIKTKTCWKTPSGSCIDLVLSNNKYSFKSSGTAESGLSDHHSLVYTMFKTTYAKLEPLKYRYRCFKFFERDLFLKQLSLMNVNVDSYDSFISNFTSLLDEFAPVKTRFLRANNKPHINKPLRKAIMTRSRLKHKAINSKRPEDWANYKTQRNRVVNMNRQLKHSYFKNKKSKERDFWSACKPFFSEKGLSSEKIVLVENDDIITDELEIANNFNHFFTNITKTLSLSHWPETFSAPLNDPIEKAIEKFKDHPSITMINTFFKNTEQLDFHCVNAQEIKEILLSLDKSKSVGGDIPISFFKSLSEEISGILTTCFNQSLNNASFPGELKIADVIPAHKKGSKTEKENYRPISLLPPLSKVFEKLIEKQLNSFMENRLSKYLCGFRKGHSTEHALLRLLNQWQKCLSGSGKVGAVLMDLSKAFDCLPHDLLIAKLNAYGLTKKSLRYVYSYLSNRKMRVRVGCTFSEWLDMLLGVPQGSVLGPLLFNIFLNDLFLCNVESEICNFADDNTLHACGSSVDVILNQLKNDASELIQWFTVNEMAVNPRKFQVLFVGCGDNPVQLDINGITILSSVSVKLLGVTIDSKLNFSQHIKNMCSKANQKISALLRIRRFLDLSQANTLCESYILSCYRYCPLIWMFCSKSDNKRIEKTHIRAIRAVTQDFTTPSDEILNTYAVDSIHCVNIRSMLIEVYKCLNKLNPRFLWDIFVPKEPSINLRSGKLLALPPQSNSTIQSFDFRGSLAWNYLPQNIKEITELSDFKRNLKKISSFYCKCKICK